MLFAHSYKIAYNKCAYNKKVPDNVRFTFQIWTSLGGHSFARLRRNFEALNRAAGDLLRMRAVISGV